jgi:Zn-dependent protease with chaperone function
MYNFGFPPHDYMLVSLPVSHYIKISLLALFLGLSLLSTSYAQQAAYVPFYDNDTIQPFRLASARNQSLKKAFVLPDGINKNYKRDYIALTNSLAENIFTTIRHKTLLDTLINPYVQGIFKQIVTSNKELPPAQLFVIRNPIENAFALGDGTILLNVALLSKLENEDQVAFVICHELAHIYLKHMQKGIKEHFDTFYSESFQKEVKKIIAEEYNINSKLNSLIQNASLNKLYHKRTYEKQADSLGYILLSKAGYDVSQAYAALQLLDKIEAPYSDQSINFQHHFGCANVNSSIYEKPKKSTSIFAVEPEQPKLFELSDTLKTHPDCKKRMKFIESLSLSYPSATTMSSANTEKFERVKAYSRFETIQSWYDEGNFDRALFETLLHLQENPENSYLQSMVLLCLYELKEHMQHHRYSDVVSRVSDYYPANFNEMLETLHNLNLSDFQGLSKCFSDSVSQKHAINEYNMAASFAYNILTNNETAAQTIKDQYLKKYPLGKFKYTLFN